MKKQLIVLAMILVLMVPFMAACASTGTTAATTAAPAGTTAAAETTAAPAGETMTIGFVVKSLADQHWVLVKAGAEAEAKKLGVNVKFIAPNSESDVQTQVDMIDTLVGESVDALCVAPSSQDAVLPALQKAGEAGIPVLAIDTDTTYDKKVAFIGTGNEAAAKMGAEYAATVVGQGAKAIILRGRLGDPTHDQREAGIKAALEAAGVEILEIKDAGSEAEKGLNVTQDLLTRFPEIDLVITTADSMAQGAQRAVEAAGVETLVMGFDGTLPVCELVIAGKMLGSTAQNPYEMGVLGIQNAVKAAKGEAVEARIDSGAVVVSKENAEAFLKELEAKVAGAQ